MNKSTLLIAIGMLLIAQLASAIVPNKISYQGLLKTDTGELVPDGDYSIAFAIYDLETGGSALWSESQNLAVIDGIFNAILGSVSSIGLDFNNPYWLGISIESDPELAPRIELGAAAYSLNADRLDGLQGASYALAGHTHLLGDLSDVEVSGASDGEVLTFDSGAGDWTASPVPASADEDWIISGNNMHSNVSGNVGVGSSTPEMKLHVRSDVNSIMGIKIENNDPGSYSAERISFSNEEGDIAGIQINDDDSPSYAGRMRIFNNRNLGNITLTTLSGGIYLSQSGNVGISNSAPSQKLDVNGTVKANGIQLPTGAAAGHVLTSDASGNGSWQAPAAGDDGDWIISGDDVYRNIGSVGIGGLPLRPAPEFGKGESFHPRTPSSTKLFVNGENEGIFGYMNETNADADDRAAIYGYRTRIIRNDGIGYAAGQSIAGVNGSNYWGDNYTFGVAGYNYNDYGDCAGVMGAQWNGNYWGALAYKDTGGTTWGTYTPNNSYTGGAMTIGGVLNANGMIRSIGNFGSGYGGTAIIAENTNTGGIALWAEASGSDATVVVGQNGSGDMMRGFLNGSLKFRVLNNGSVVTPVLQITGGSDLAEPFAVTGQEAVQAGSVLVIDDKNPGKLKLSDREYDRRVAGVVSGAGGVNPGLTLNQKSVFEEGENLALSGRAYARADVSNGPIHPGDMLTTSSRSGYAMKATDRDRSHGAVIGKAMSSLEEGTGLVLVLVNLQ